MSRRQGLCHVDNGETELEVGGRGEIADRVVTGLITKRARDHVLAKLKVRVQSQASPDDKFLLEDRQRLTTDFEQERLGPGDALEVDPVRGVETQLGRNEPVLERLVRVDVETCVQSCPDRHAVAGAGVGSSGFGHGCD